MPDQKQRLLIYNAPTPTQNETGPPIAYDTSFGMADGEFAIISIAGVDIDGDGIDEIAALNHVLPGNKQRLLIYNAPTPTQNETGPPIAYDTSFGTLDGEFAIISIAGVDIDVNGIDEIVALNRMPNQKQRLLIYDAPTPTQNETGPPVTYDASFGSAATNERVISIARLRHYDWW
jgi:hypothetical protein